MNKHRARPKNRDLVLTALEQAPGPLTAEEIARRVQLHQDEYVDYKQMSSIVRELRTRGHRIETRVCGNRPGTYMLLHETCAGVKV